MKHNPQVALELAKREILRLRQELDLIKAFTIRQCQDVAMVELNQEFDFDPEDNAKFEKGFTKLFVELCQICVDDVKDDKSIEYTKGALDRAVVKACGDAVPPFEQRYATENLYFRSKDIDEGTKQGENTLTGERKRSE